MNSIYVHFSEMPNSSIFVLESSAGAFLNQAEQVYEVLEGIGDCYGLEPSVLNHVRPRLEVLHNATPYPERMYPVGFCVLWPDSIGVLPPGSKAFRHFWGKAGATGLGIGLYVVPTGTDRANIIEDMHYYHKSRSIWISEVECRNDNEQFFRHTQRPGLMIWLWGDGGSVNVAGSREYSDAAKRVADVLAEGQDTRLVTDLLRFLGSAFRNAIRRLRSRLHG